MEINPEKKRRKLRSNSKYLFQNHMFKTIFNTRALNRIPLKQDKPQTGANIESLRSF
jgi:hypothetical protein